MSERLFSTIFQNSIINTASDQKEIEETTYQSKAFLKEVMENSINKFLEEPAENITNPKTLRTEFSLFEATHKRTKNLDLLFDALKTIKPSSVPSERVFSIAGNFCVKN